MYDIDKIQLRMLERGLNRWRLSLKIGQSSSVVTRFFRTGRAHIDTVTGICRVLGLKIGDILSDTEKSV